MQEVAGGRALLQDFGSNTLTGYRPGTHSGDPCPGGQQHCNFQDKCVNVMTDSLNCGALPWCRCAACLRRRIQCRPRACLLTARRLCRNGLAFRAAPECVAHHGTQGGAQTRATSTRRSARVAAARASPAPPSAEMWASASPTATALSARLLSTRRSLGVWLAAQRSAVTLQTECCPAKLVICNTCCCAAH